MIIHRCSTCKEVKDKEDFARRNERPEHVRTGRQSSCIKCNTSKITPEMNRRSTAKYRKKYKDKVFKNYSQGSIKCACCGESNEHFLTLDHINNDGAKHRRQVPSVFKDLVDNNYPKGYQVLCYNCNCGRAHNNGICPHEEI